LGMFGRWGGAPSAIAAMSAALVVYSAGAYGGLLAHPFLWSLVAATLSYFGALLLSPPGRALFANPELP